MRKENDDQWRKFQDLMSFLDDLRNHGIWYCRRTSEAEQKWTSQLFTDISFTDIEKSVRRYLSLPTKEETEIETTRLLEEIRRKHREDELRKALHETLPGVAEK